MTSFPQAATVIAFGALLALAAAWAPFRAYLRPREGASKPSPRWAGAAVLALMVASIAVYAAIGRPGLMGEAMSDRLARIEEIRKKAPEQLSGQEMLAILAAKARSAPADPRPHYFSGVIHMGEGRPQEAARAFDQALRRNPGDPATMLELGAAMVAAEGRIVTPEALALFDAVAKARPEELRPVFFQALAASQDGRREDALRLWPEVIRRLPRDDPRQIMAARMLAEAQAPAADATRRPPRPPAVAP